MGERLKVAEILDGRIHHIYPEYRSVDEAYKFFSKELIFIEIPDYVGELWGYNPHAEGDDRFVKPELDEGWYWDENGNPFNALVSRETERNDLISRADADALIAYRAKRNGDTSIDWDVWIDELENFVSGVRATIGQEDYPLKVVYPDYPTKPTK